MPFEDPGDDVLLLWFWATITEQSLPMMEKKIENNSEDN